MKLYLIKSKDGRYYSNNLNLDSDIFNAIIYTSQKIADFNIYCIKNAFKEQLSTVEIEITSLIERSNGVVFNYKKDYAEGIKTVIFPKLEEDNAHKGYWYLYELDNQGNITYTSFKATKEEALARLEELKGDHK